MANAETPTPSTTTTTLSDLSDPPLDALFDRLPLRKLLLIDEVCSRWRDLKPVAFSRRRHLIIANGQNDLPALQPDLFSKRNQLKYVLQKMETEEEDGSRTSSYLERFIKRLDRHALFIGLFQPLPAGTLNRLLVLLPNLTVFQLVQWNGILQVLEKVVQLLDHYRQQLLQVTIVFRRNKIIEEDEQIRIEEQRSTQQMFTSLMVTLNSMKALRNLNLSFQTAPGCPVVIADSQLLKHSLPDLVGRLETLTFWICLNDISDRAADTRLLKQVIVGMRDGGGGGGGADKSGASSSKQVVPALYLTNVPLSLRTLISLGPGPVAAGLRSVEIDGRFSANSKAEYKALARFARQTPHLQALTISLKGLTIWRLVESLASLKEIVHLNINCIPIWAPPEEEAVNVGQLSVLPSVKSLQLTYVARGHRNFEQLHLETLFPNLQTVQWDHLGHFCSDCGYQVALEMLFQFERGQGDVAQFKADYGRKMSECLRLSRMAAFSRLPQLTHLLMTNGPGLLPFKPELFTGRQSLDRQTEFIEVGVDPRN